MMKILNELHEEKFQMVIKNKLTVRKTKKEEKNKQFLSSDKIFLIVFFFFLQELRNCGPLF